MKYEKPMCEISHAEAEDVLTSSSGFEISKNEANEGEIKIECSQVFGDVF